MTDYAEKLVYNGNTKIFLGGLLMTNQEIQSYQKMGIPVGRKRKKARHITYNELLEYGLLFLLNKIFLFGGLSPFGLSFFATVFPKGKKCLGIFVAAAGILSAGMGIISLKYLGALAILTTFSIFMEKEFSEHFWLYALTAACSLAVTGFIFILLNDFLLYDMMMQLLESSAIFLSFFLFRKATDVLTNIGQRTVFEPTETMSLAFLCAGVILSLKTVSVFEGAAHVLSLIVIYIAGMTGGFSLSCPVGILLGLVNSLTEVLPAQVVAAYSVSAFCSGFFRNKGRWGVILGFFGASALAALYFSGWTDHTIAFYYVLVAGVLLFLIPERFLSLFGEVMMTPSCQEDSVQRLRDLMEDKLTEVSNSFAELSGVFCEAVACRVDSDIKDPGYVFDKTADQICRNCSLMNYCWQKEYNETKHSLITLYNRMEMRGRAEAEDVPAGFKRECIRLDHFLEVLNKNYDMHKINLLWAGRVAESRNLVAEQFKNVSSVLEHMKRELLYTPDDGIRLERKITAALDKEGIEVSHVRVSGVDGLEVALTMESCGGEGLCGKKVAAIIGHAVGAPMLRIPTPCKSDACRLKFREKSRYNMEAGFAQVAGGNGAKNGDHHMMSLAADGRFILALSDGMGQGNEAEAQSGLTVRLIRRLLSAGFDKETALRLINSMLMVSAERDSFATADLCLVNLFSGALEFIKIGAANSYIKQGEFVEKIGCTSLPAGIVSELEADCDLKYAKEGDFVIMVTDGVTDALETMQSSRLITLIQEFKGESSQKLADLILRAAVSASGGVAKDDMTVLVARLVRA